MRVIDHITAAKGKPLFSFEVLPPKKGEDINNLFDCVEPLMEFDPAFIDVTYHREEYIYTTRPDGSVEKRTTRKRPGTVGICAAIMNKFHVDAVPHLICGGFTKEDTENALIDLDFLGIDNILALRGDAIKSEGKFIPHPYGNAYATDLIQQIQDLNQGKYLEDDLDYATKMNFSIGVAAYPEKHFDAPTMDSDIYYLKKKVEMGAEYAVTQMFFDNQKYFDFVDRCRAEGITIPIIPGLKPLATKRQVEVLPDVFFIDMPEDLVKAVKACKDNSEVKEVGVEWAVQQCKELIDGGAPVMHFYTMSKSELTRRIASELF